MPNNFENLIGVYLGSAQDLENNLNTLLSQSGYAADINLINGIQLDNYGQLFNLQRKGLDDTSYRATIKVMILANRSTGTINDLVEVIQEYVSSVSGFSASPIIKELGDANLFIQFGFISSEYERVQDLKNFVNIAKAAGVGFYGWYDTTLTPFQFGNIPVVSGSNTGFGETPVGTDPVSSNGPGGEFSGVI